MQALQRALESYVAASNDGQVPASLNARAAVGARLRELYEDRSPGGVFFDEAADDTPFTFAVAADLQEGPDPRKFPHLLDTVAHQDNVDFLLLAGDLADADASSNWRAMAINILGLAPPRSPYAHEFQVIARHLRAFPKPVVAVPGNHDGYVGYPGIGNMLASFCWLWRFGAWNDDDIPEWVRFLDGKANEWIPVGAKLRIPGGWPNFSRIAQTGKLERDDFFGGLFACQPRYDGLAEWRYALGPTSYSFNFRGQHFIGINSYNLNPLERSAVGAVVFNWGGGIHEGDRIWIDASMDGFSKDSSKDSQSFVFMHHDPRGAYPIGAPNQVDRYGIYDNVENLFSTLSAGHFGLGHSYHWDLYLPVLTPAAFQASRFLDDWINARRSRHQEVWLRRSGMAARISQRSEFYGAEELVGTITKNLWHPAGRDGAASERGLGISHVFFGHDNTPLLEGPWVHWNSEAGVVFPQLPQEKWEGREFHRTFRRFPLPYSKEALRLIFKLRNDEPPDWAKAAYIGWADRNAKVIRLDDVGDDTDVDENGSQSNGYHWVEVRAKGRSLINYKPLRLPKRNDDRRREAEPEGTISPPTGAETDAEPGDFDREWAQPEQMR